MIVSAVVKFERFFRVAAGLDVDKSDLKRYGDFINKKLYDLLLRGQAAAKANARSVIEPFDLPITKGLQESIHAFKSLDEPVDMKRILEGLIARRRDRSDVARNGRQPQRGPRPCVENHRSHPETPAWRAIGLAFRARLRGVHRARA
jgi:Domain of unknown function (DUF1931)